MSLAKIAAVPVVLTVIVSDRPAIRGRHDLAALITLTPTRRRTGIDSGRE